MALIGEAGGRGLRDDCAFSDHDCSLHPSTFHSFHNYLTSSCLWDGVRCDLAGRVAVLDLEDKDFSGDLPRVLYMLQHLSSLSLKSNQDLGATDGLPTFLIHMPLLNSINVCGTGYGASGSNAICAKDIETSLSTSSSTSSSTSGEDPPEIVIYADFSCDCCQACPM